MTYIQLYTEKKQLNYIAEESDGDLIFKRRVIRAAHKHIDIEKLEKVMQKAGIEPDNPLDEKKKPDNPSKAEKEADKCSWDLDFLN